MKRVHQPGIFSVVKVVLMLNMICGGFLILVLLSAVLIDSFSSSFENMEVVLNVRKISSDTTQRVLDETSGYGFKQSKAGDLIVMMPWYTQLFVPFGVVNISDFDMSIPYWIFYGALSFLFYRIIAATEIESPFSDKNIKRIFWIGYILILYDAFMVLRFLVLSNYVDTISNRGFRYDGLEPLVYFKVGILVIILAMIYRRGVAIQREQELTI